MNEATGEDYRLMIRVREGDLDALGDLFERFHRRLYAFCMRLVGHPPTAEDLVQEVFCRILKYRHTFRDGGDVAVWLYRLSRNVCIDHLRKAGRAQTVAFAIEEGAKGEPEPPCDQPLPNQDLESAESLDQLAAALGRLPREARELLILARLEKLRYEQIGRLLGCTVGAVKVRVHRATKALRREFSALTEGAT